MIHVSIPFLVILVLSRVSTAPIINCGFVRISVENVDVSEPSAHFDALVTCTAIGAFTFLAVFLWPGVSAYALRPILQASIVIVPVCAEIYTPEEGDIQMKDDP